MTLKNTALLRKIFDVLCKEQMGKMFFHDFACSQSMGICELHVSEPLKVRPILMVMGSVFDGECAEREIDPTFTIPAELKCLCMSSAF